MIFDPCNHGIVAVEVCIHNLGPADSGIRGQPFSQPVSTALNSCGDVGDVAGSLWEENIVKGVAFVGEVLDPGAPEGVGGRAGLEDEGHYDDAGV